MNVRWKFSFQRTFGVFLIILSITVSTVAININYQSNKTMSSLLELTKDNKKVKSTDENLGDYEGILSNQEVEVSKGVSQINIPKLKIKAPIVEGTDSYSLSVSAGHFANTAKMGKKGNYCIAGHSSSIYNCIFNDIHNIKLLEPMYLTNSVGKTFTYYVTDKFIVEPTQMEVLKQDTSDKICTIITCTDNGARRLIIRGQILSKKKLEELRNQMGLNIDKDYLEKLDEIGYLQFDYRMTDDNLGNDTVWHTFGVTDEEVPDFSQRNMKLFSSLPVERIKVHSIRGNEPQEYKVYKNKKSRVSSFIKQIHIDVKFEKSLGLPDNYIEQPIKNTKIKEFDIEEDLFNVRENASNDSSYNNWFDIDSNIQKRNTKDSNNFSMSNRYFDLYKHDSTR